MGDSVDRIKGGRGTCEHILQKGHFQALPVRWRPPPSPPKTAGVLYPNVGRRPVVSCFWKKKKKSLDIFKKETRRIGRFEEETPCSGNNVTSFSRGFGVLHSYDRLYPEVCVREVEMDPSPEGGDSAVNRSKIFLLFRVCSVSLSLLRKESIAILKNYLFI